MLIYEDELLLKPEMKDGRELHQRHLLMTVVTKRKSCFVFCPRSVAEIGPLSPPNNIILLPYMLFPEDGVPSNPEMKSGRVLHQRHLLMAKGNSCFVLRILMRPIK